MNHEMVDALRKDLKPEAEEFLAIMEEDDLPTTKHGYGTVMSFISPMPREAQAAFIGALADAGWDAVTAAALTRAMGLT